MKPIFIGGCGRSGTTLLASLLAAHSQVVAPPEAQFFLEGLAVHRRETGDDSSAFAASVEGSWRYRLWDLPKTLPMELAREPLAPAQIMSRIARVYAEVNEKPHADRWVDHTPINIGFAPTLLGEFADARMIHLVRDPRAVVASVLPLDWGPASARESARWWLSRIAMGLAAESLFPDRVIRVRYEDLVREPEGSLERLFMILGLESAPGMVTAWQPRLPSYTQSQHALVGRPPDPARIEAWRSALSPREIAVVEAELKEMPAMLGYEAVDFAAPFDVGTGPTEFMASAFRTARQRWVRRGRIRQALGHPAGHGRIGSRKT